MKNKFVPVFVLMLGFLGFSYQAGQQDPWEVPEKYVKMKNPYAGDSDSDQIGSELYSQYCTVCHGKTGKGDGPNSGLIEIPVGDFTSAAFKNQPDGSVYYKLVKGRGVMPGFEPVIEYEEDRWLLVNYIKKL